MNSLAFEYNAQMKNKLYKLSLMELLFRINYYYYYNYYVFWYNSLLFVNYGLVTIDLNFKDFFDLWDQRQIFLTSNIVMTLLTYYLIWQVKVIVMSANGQNKFISIV